MVKPATGKKDRFQFPYTESELLAGMTPELAHADELAKLSASLGIRGQYIPGIARTREKAQALKPAGAIVCTSPAEAGWFS